MSDNKAKTRRYHLKNAAGDERIINATSKAAAIGHAARTEWSATVLTIDDAIRLSKEGVVEEVAGEAPVGDGDIVDAGRPEDFTVGPGAYNQ
jgi:hypothetical protein